MCENCIREKELKEKAAACLNVTIDLIRRMLIYDTKEELEQAVDDALMFLEGYRYGLNNINEEELN